jgi:ribonuclease-3
MSTAIVIEKDWTTISKKRNSPNKYSGGNHYDQDTIKINPYNPNNFLASKEQVEDILKKVGVNLPVRNLKLYHLAFTHKSYLKRILQNKMLDVQIVREPNVLELQEDSNERLEFLGDQITNSIIVYFLYRTFPTEQEGFLTKLKTNLISTQFYARFARYLGLQRFLVISKHVEEQGNGRNNDKILENVFESFMGALFEDFSNIPSVYTQKLGLLSGPGYEVCEKLVVHLLQKLIDFDDLTQNDTNYKDILLRFYQATFQIVPRYVEISSTGPPNNRMFTMGVFDKDGNIVGRGIGNSKKKAEQLASQDALKAFGKL